MVFSEPRYENVKSAVAEDWMSQNLSIAELIESAVQSILVTAATSLIPG